MRAAICKIVFLMLITFSIQAQEQPTEDGGSVTAEELEPVTTPEPKPAFVLPTAPAKKHKHMPVLLRSLSTEGVNTLYSKGFWIVSQTSQFGPVAFAAETGMSEGTRFNNALLGWRIQPLSGDAHVLRFELRAGLSRIKEANKSVFGIRSLFATPKFTLESSISKFSGAKGWINGEPMVDACYKAIGILWVCSTNSLWSGLENSDSKEHLSPLAEIYEPNRVTQVFSGGGAMLRRKHWEAGVAYEKPVNPVNKDMKSYVQFFMSFNWDFPERR